MKSKVLLLLFLFAGQLAAQDRYMVFFTDKSNTPYQIGQAHEFLSDRAIARRLKHSVEINESDLPVDPAYVQGVAELGAATFFTTKWMNGVITQMDESTAQQVANLPYVESVEYVARGVLLSHTANETPNQLAINDQNNAVMPTAFQNEMIGVDDMHANGIYGDDVLIGIFDDGFSNFQQIPALAHLTTEDKILYTQDFTTNADQVENVLTHGTRVLSVMAGDDGNYLGVVPEAQYILSITEAPEEYRVEEYNWLFAAEKADSAGVDIINTSLGYADFFDEPNMNYGPEDMNGQTAVISIAAQMAADKGIFVVASAGNYGGDLRWGIVTAPADVKDVFSVGAVNRSGIRSFFSSIGPNALGQLKPNASALGTGTAVIEADGSYLFQNGTSFSAPLVAGLAAGILSEFPYLTKDELFDMLLRSSSQFDRPDNEIGYGIPNYVAAERLLNIQDAIAPNDILLFPNPLSQGNLRIAMGEAIEGEIEAIYLYNRQGELVWNGGIEQQDPVVSVDLSHLQAGLYLVQIKSTAGTRTKKLVIR